MMTILAFWHWVQSWRDIMLSYGLAGLAMAGLVVAAILIPWLAFKVRVALVIAAAIILGHTIAFTVGIKQGADRVKADWDWTLGAEAIEGEKARTDAEHTVADSPGDDGMRNDPWNRDRWKQ